MKLKYEVSLSVLLAALIFFSGFAHGKAHAAYAEDENYLGSRWKNTTICVQNQVDNKMLRMSVYDAVKNIDSTTNLRVLNFGSSSCANSGYTQIVYVVDNNYINDGRMAYVKWNGHTWGNTTTGLSTYFNKSGVQVRLNTRWLSKYPAEHTWDHIAVHELGHALGGLNERYDTCTSVMTMKSGCSGNKPTTLQSADKSLINKIYSW